MPTLHWVGKEKVVKHHHEVPFKTLRQTKGDDRDNSHSACKLKLGREWEKQAGKQFRYFMVFDNKPIDGAYKLADALGVLGQL